MPLKMREDQVGIIVCKSRSHIIFCQAHAAFYRQDHRTIFILNLKISNISKSMILRHLIVHGGFSPGTTISSIALYNRTIHRLY